MDDRLSKSSAQVTKRVRGELGRHSIETGQMPCSSTHLHPSIDTGRPVGHLGLGSLGLTSLLRAQMKRL